MSRQSTRLPAPLEEIEEIVNLESVDVGRLRPVGRRPALGSYLRGLWERRHFILADSRARAFSGNRDTLLGNLWLVGRPVLDGLAYFIIFGVLLGTSRGVENYLAFLLVGVFMFSFTSRCFTGGAGVMKSGQNLIRAFAFPRAAIPIAFVLRETISMFPVIGAMLIMIAAVPPHAVITWRWALFPVVVLLQAFFNAGLVFYTARIASAVPDLRMVLAFVSRFWLYGSGVMFSLERFITHPRALEILQFNPGYCVLEISRDLLVYGRNPDATLWLTLIAWAIVTPVLGFLYFWHAEEEYGRG